MCADVDPTSGVDLEPVPLFSDPGEDYFRQVDNDGMRNVQMRFYDLSTTTNGGDCTRNGKRDSVPLDDVRSDHAPPT